jgi:hypothetical protein
MATLSIDGYHWMIDVPDEEDDTKDVLDARQEHSHDRSKLRVDVIKLFFVEQLS